MSGSRPTVQISDNNRDDVPQSLSHDEASETTSVIQSEQASVVGLMIGQPSRGPKFDVAIQEAPEVASPRNKSSPMKRRQVYGSTRFMQEIQVSMMNIYRDAGMTAPEDACEEEIIDEPIRAPETLEPALNAPVQSQVEGKKAASVVHNLDVQRSNNVSTSNSANPSRRHSIVGDSVIAHAAFKGQERLQSQQVHLQSFGSDLNARKGEKNLTKSMTLAVPADAANIARKEAEFFFPDSRANGDGVLAILPTAIADHIRSKAMQSNPNFLQDNAIPTPKNEIPSNEPKLIAHEQRNNESTGLWWWLTSPKGGFHQYITNHILMDEYPTDSTPEERLDIYLEKRQWPKYQANMWQLLGLGVAAVISGEFSGWNASLKAGGYGGFWVANIVAAIMYLMLALCLSEMATSIPVVGGAFAFARAIGGDGLGFITGNAENVEYAMFVSLLMVGFADAFAELVNIDPASDYALGMAPVFWVIILAPCLYLLINRPKASWDFMKYGTFFVGFQIVLFCLYTMTKFDNSQVTSVPIDDSNRANNIGNDGTYFPSGFGGVLVALPPSAWFFTGFECIALTAKESKNPSRDIPRALVGSWFFLLCCAVLLSIFNVLVPPGANEISNAAFPMVTVMIETAGDAAKTPSLLYMFPVQFVNMVGMLFCSSRQFWALSRAGYLPQFLSICTDGNENIPKRSIAAACSYSIAFAFLTYYARALHGSVSPTDVLTMLTVIAGSVTYACIGITYILFRVKYPKAPRPFKSPAGIPGAIILVAISLTMVISMASLSDLFQYTLLGLAVKMSFSAIYFVFYGRLHLLPTEDRLLAAFWRAAGADKPTKHVVAH